MGYYAYILYNAKHDTFYIGQTYSLLKRIIMEHKAGLGKYTGRYDGEWLLLYFEKFATRAEAMQKEKEWKEFKSKVYLKKYQTKARLAQLVRASRLHREGRGFESLGAHQKS